MIYDNTTNKKQHRKQIDQLIGPPFNLLERLKHGGNSSSLLDMVGLSFHLAKSLGDNLDTIRLTIELRNKGILVHLKNQSQELLWPIAYYRLSLYQSDYFSIHAEGQYIRIDKNSMTVKNRRFLKKLIQFRIDYLTFIP